MKNLKRSFIALFLLVLSAFIVALSLLAKAEYETRKLDAMENRAEKLSKILFEISHLDEVFLLNKQQSTVDEYNKLVKKYIVLKNSPIEFKFLYLPLLVRSSEIPSQVNLFIEIIDEYIYYSQQLFIQQKLLGLNHESGLYGSFREEVHMLHNFFKIKKYLQLELTLYKMRRHEKDFMLRGLTKYLELYTLEYNSLKKAMLKLKDRERGLMLQKLDEYHQNFTKLVEVSKVIGYTNGKDGLIQKLSDDKVLINRYFNELMDEIITTKNAVNIHNTIYYAVISVLILLLAIQFVMAKTNIDRAKDNNPLTGLNGNRKIEDYLKYVLKRKSERLIIYFDFDNFKPFNDRFGFKIGDDAIFIFSEILKKYFAREKHFIGHIGGDDFIVIVDKANFDKSIKKVYQSIEDFEDYVRTFYTQEEQERNRVTLKDRFGVMREVALLSVSAGIIEIRKENVLTYDENFSEIIANIKKSSKISKVAITTILQEGMSLGNK